MKGDAAGGVQYIAGVQLGGNLLLPRGAGLYKSQYTPRAEWLLANSHSRVIDVGVVGEIDAAAGGAIG